MKLRKLSCHAKPRSLETYRQILNAQKRAEAALQESEEHFRMLVESTALATWETDADGVVVNDLPSWRRYTGQSLEECTDYGWLNAVHPDVH